jgi:hypothetical protein
MAIEFGLIGSGWRSEFYLRIARELPEHFTISGIVTRDEIKGRSINDRWGVKTYRTVEELLVSQAPSFVVVSVARAAAPMYVKDLVEKGVPVLLETPPGPDLQSMRELYRTIGKDAKVQVAEQYQFQPLNAACLSIARSGKLGRVHQAQISVAHDYHGISLMRKLLEVEFENASIRAQRFSFPIVQGPNREGPPKREETVMSDHWTATFDFGGKVGMYDFTPSQYFSWIRSHRLLVRGDRGEINHDQVSYLKDFRSPLHLDLKRINTGADGNLEGMYHKGILLGGEWVYENPFVPARLSDDEIAVAACLEKMHQYVNGGPGFYSLAEAAQDYYLGLLMNEAVSTENTVVSAKQIWVD